MLPFSTGVILEPLPLERLLALSSSTTPQPARQMQPGGESPSETEDVHPWLDLLRRQDAGGLRHALVRMINERGLARTLIEGISPMNVLVGQSWLEGRLAVHEEHLYTEVVQGTLRHAMVALQPPARPPRVLLTTLPGEQHGLGLLMAECFMVLEGCNTVPLGVQTPIPDLVNAVAAAQADVVALSFTAAQNPRDVRAALDQLRAQELLKLDALAAPDDAAVLALQFDDVADDPVGRALLDLGFHHVQDAQRALVAASTLAVFGTCFGSACLFGLALGFFFWSTTIGLQ